MPFHALPFALPLVLARLLWPTLVHCLPLAEVEGLPRLYSNAEARKFTRTGVNKWTRVKKEIDCVVIDGREWYTADALLAYLKRKTRKRRPPGPRTEPTPKLTPPAAESAQAANSKVPRLQRPQREAERRRATRTARVGGTP
jgi:hypothetical protein